MDNNPKIDSDLHVMYDGASGSQGKAGGGGGGGGGWYCFSFGKHAD